MRIGWLLGSALVATLALACSSSSTTNPYPDVSSFCQALAAAECGTATVAGAANYCALTPTACTTARTAKCNALASGQTSTTPDIDPFASVTSSRAFTSSAAGDCIDATKALYASQAAITIDQFKAQQTKCNLVFQGAGVNESPCQTSFDCSGGLICDKSVCAQESTVSAGAFCASPGQVCDDTSFCATDSSNNKKCVAKVAIGIQCSTAAGAIPCATGAVCQNSACVAQFPAGTACTSSDQCSSSASFCDPNAGNKCDTGLLLGGGAKACNAYGATN